MAELEGAVAESETAIIGGDDGSNDGSNDGIGSNVGDGQPGSPELDRGKEVTDAGDDSPGVDEAEPPSEPGFEKLPKQYSKDKFVKGLYHANQELRKVFPGGVREAIEVKGKLEGLGGVEALADIETQRAGWERIDKDFAEGNPGVLEDIAAESPEGFVKLMGPALDKFRQVDQAAYNHSLGKIFWNTMEGGGPNSFLSVLSGIREALDRGDTDAAIGKFAGVEQFLKGIQGYAQKVPEKSIDPEREKFQSEKAKWESERAREFEQGVYAKTREYTVGKIESQLAKEFTANGRNLEDLKKTSPRAYHAIMRSCYDDLSKEITKDGASVNRFKAAIKQNNSADAVKLATARVDALHAKIVADTYKEFYREIGKKTQPAAQPPKPGQQKAAPGVMKLSRAPLPENFDKLRMIKEFGVEKTNSMIYNSRGYLKGKPALYDWN
jgi:hypothetical protein